MPNKVIYLTKELYDAAVLESNFSEFVANAFRNYLQTKKSVEELKNEAQKLEEKKEALIRETDQELKKVEKDIAIVEKEEETSEEAKTKKAQKLADRISACISNTEEMFNVKLTEAEAVEFLEGDYRNIKHYLEEKKDANI